MLTDRQLAAAFEMEREQGGVEFKAAGPRTNRLLVAKVIRAMLAMSNRRDGGYVIIGFEDNGGRIKPVGVSEEDIASWTYDALADAVSRYAEPSVAFDLSIVALKGLNFVVIEVGEFTEVPILCRRDHNDERGRLVLREGACYVRPRRKPETMEVATYADMRDLVDLAVEKGVRRFLATTARVGLRAEPWDTAEQDYHKQSEDFS